MSERLAENTTNPEQPAELTPAQVKEIREKRSGWYKEQISYLEPQLSYQRMVAEIEQLKAITAESQLKQAQIYLAIKSGQSIPEDKAVSSENKGKEETP